jgi:hypothetical protein
MKRMAVNAAASLRHGWRTVWKITRIPVYIQPNKRLLARA